MAGPEFDKSSKKFSGRCCVEGEPSSGRAGRLQQMLHGTPNPVQQWKPLFDWGSEPADDLAVYPPFEAIQIIACHAIGHMGGLTVVRAASGKQRLFIPSEDLRAF